MHSQAYMTGFVSKLAECEKSAKFWNRMTPEERRSASKADAKMEREYRKNVVYAEPPDPEPRNLKERWRQLGKILGTTVKSTGRGLASASAATGVRSLESLYDMAIWAPEMADGFLFGRLAGIDEGRGFLGRKINQVRRFADKTVHNIRKWSEDYDQRHRINNKLNRFIQGPGADMVGSFIGLRSLGGTLAGGSAAGRLLSNGAGAFFAANELLPGRHKELRQREAWLRSLDPRYRQYFDPTSTASNQQGAPTLEEYRRYHMPSHGIPASYSGRLRIPWSWYHDEHGDPTQFRNFGT